MRSISALPATLLVLLATYNFPYHACAEDTSPGVKIEITQPAGCTRPTRSGDTIAVHYIGTLLSTGAEFDQSYTRGKPITFALGAGQVIKGWDEGLLDMCPGEGRKLTIPPELAYGKYGSPPVIPGDATLVFETELVDIVGVEVESITFPEAEAATATEGDFSIATAPPEPPVEDDKTENDSPPLESTPLTTDPPPNQTGRCHLLGPFALLVQGALGGMAILSLVYKRWRETNKRPWKIWFFDVSKQVFGSVLTHILNLTMSMLGAVDMMNAAAQKAKEINASGEAAKAGRSPNPCSFYLLNLAIDTTLGIPILYLLLKVLHAAFAFTPLARPPQSIKSGNYGQPPRATWYLKQLLIYFIGLTGMKLFVLLLFALLPWLPWVGDWALRWTEGNEALQVAFAMFVFPLAMNAVQYWIIDNFIMDKTRGKEGAESGSGSGHSYRQVNGDDDDEAEGRRMIDDDETFAVGDEDDDEIGKDGSGAGSTPILKEVNPTPIPDYEDVGEGSRKPSPLKS